MTTAIKDSLIDRLTSRFSNVTARAAAVNEVLTAADYASCYRAISVNAVDPIEALYLWAVARGELWNS